MTLRNLHYLDFCRCAKHVQFFLDINDQENSLVIEIMFSTYYIKARARSHENQMLTARPPAGHSSEPQGPWAGSL